MLQSIYNVPYPSFHCHAWAIFPLCMFKVLLHIPVVNHATLQVFWIQLSLLLAEEENVQVWSQLGGKQSCQLRLALNWSFLGPQD